MGHLIADKYKEWESECDARFRQLKANEKELSWRKSYAFIF